MNSIKIFLEKLIRTKEKKYIPYGKHAINKRDIISVVKVLKSNFITQGPKVEKFEKEICKKLDVNFSVATNSATSALHIACLSLGLQKGDIVWTSPITFVASANCALYCQAEIDFVDIDIKNGLISICELEKKLEHAQSIGKLPKILIPVHLAGTSCDMHKIKQLSEIYKFKVIEDASHSIGGKFFGSYIGNCKYSDITVFSFHPVKIITTGEGGIATTNNLEIFEKMGKLRSHGIEKNINKLENKSNDKPWLYEQQILGFNYRMNDIEAALGLSQLKRLDNIVKKRNDIRKFYLKELHNLPVKVLEVEPNILSSVHLLVIVLDKEYRKYHSEIFNFLKNKNIGVQLHYIPVHSHPYYKKLGFKIGDFPVSEEYANSAITLPLFPELNKRQVKKIIEILKFEINKIGSNFI